MKFILLYLQDFCKIRACFEKLNTASICRFLLYIWSFRTCGVLFKPSLLLLCISFTLSTVTMVHVAFAGSQLLCKKKWAVEGAEDIEINEKNSVAYFSSQDRRNMYTKQGAIYALSLKTSMAKPEPMEINRHLIFHPHGISLLASGHGLYLYAVNHVSKKEHTIELFKIENKKLIHQQTFKNALLKDPNDLHVISHKQFFVTNFSHHNVLFYNGKQWSIAAKNIPYANGITGTSDKRNIYIVSTMNQRLYHYLYKKDLPLQKRSSVPLDFFGDNVSIKDDKQLFVTGHKSFPSFLAHRYIRKISSPSAIKVIPLRQSDFTLENIYPNYDLDISSASVAVLHHHKLIIGTVFEPYSAECLEK